MRLHGMDAADLVRRDKPIGLLAGWGRFPIYFAERARELKLPVVCLAIRDEASPELKGLVHRFYWTGVARLGRMIRCFKREGVEQIVMAGKVHKTRMFGPLRMLRLLPDWRFIRFWFSRNRQNNSDDSILLGIIGEFARDGMMFSSALDLCPELLAKPGLLTNRAPTAQEQADIDFGWTLAKEMGRLDVGQSVSVKERAVLAVEAIEGTDRAILRAGELCRKGGFVVVKVAKPKQDMRFDVPTVGVSTMETMKKAGARVLGIEGEKTILIDQEETIRLANRYGITILALTNR
jgi:DUF1009 family protein